MSLQVLYYVYNRDNGDLVAFGTAKECAMQLTVTDSAVRSWARDQSPRRKYNVTRTEPLSSEHVAAIRSWEAFCEPIRKKYKIKVRRAEDG